uniref:Uncharacterized protein n=1 Tax=Trichobilharzia regenti TaxID=157069 RepID=A0AA85KKL4_TRIRE|nr:unnamed protein product [Trichobilharzia regenti]
MKDKQTVSATLSEYQIPTLIKFVFVSSISLIEMVIVTVLLCFFYDFKTVRKNKPWQIYILIFCSTILSLLIAYFRDLRSRFPVNYIILYLNILLLCYAFIPPMMCVGLTYVFLSYFVSAILLYVTLAFGMLCKIKFFYRWFVYFLVGWVVVSSCISIILYFLHFEKGLYHFMGVAFLLFVIPLLLRIGQLLATQESERMFGSHFISGSLALSFIFLSLFYSVVIQFFPYTDPSQKNFNSCRPMTL